MAIETPARIAIVGAGPIGLEAALYARYLGYDVDLYERGRVAENVLRWRHVRMFTPFGLNRSPLALAALKAQGSQWTAPADDALLTGREYAERFLIPLAHSDLLVDGLHERTDVLSIVRDGPLKGEFDAQIREDFAFRLLACQSNDGGVAHERFATADVVIDASGTFGQGNWLGQGGIPAIGERAARQQIEFGLPDALGAMRDHYGGRNILVVGDGATAAANVVALAQLATQARDTWITWLVRAECDEKSPQPIRRIADDPLPERDRVARLANQLAGDESNHVTLLSGTTVEAISWHAGLSRFSLRLGGKHAGDAEFDRVIASVGYRPDSRIYEELQVAQCPVTGAPGGMPTVEGASLVQHEPDFYVLGAKSHGRESSFLIREGLEQIRRLFAILGDRAELNLYATMDGLLAR